MQSPTIEKHFVTIDGHRIAYTVAGNPDHPPLLMVHGWLSFSGIWDQTIEAFKASHYCIAIDLLGHGDSDKPVDGDYSIAAQTARVLALADVLGVEQFTLLGHSMGGLISFYMALQVPERVTRIVDVSGVVNGRLSLEHRLLVAPILRVGTYFPAVWGISRVLMHYHWYARYYDRLLLYEGVTDYDHPDRQMALQKGIEIPGYRDLQAIAAVNLVDRLREIRVPVLVIFGLQDGTVPVINGYIVQEQVPHSKLVLLDACSHIPMREKPEEYLNALRQFLC